MKFFLQDDTSKHVDDILKSLKKLMDGDVSSQMKQKGIEYTQIYGTSVIWLREMAKKYTNDNKLANRLWHRQIRETMILATLIASPKTEFINTLNEWTESLITNEIAEQIGTNLLWKVPNIYDYTLKLLQSENDRKRAAAWVALATYLQRGGNLTEDQNSYLFSEIKSEKHFKNIFTQRTVSRFLRQACRNSTKNLNQVEELIQQLKTNNKISWLIEDVETEIKYLK